MTEHLDSQMLATAKLKGLKIAWVRGAAEDEPEASYTDILGADYCIEPEEVQEPDPTHVLQRLARLTGIPVDRILWIGADGEPVHVDAAPGSERTIGSNVLGEEWLGTAEAAIRHFRRVMDDATRSRRMRHGIEKAFEESLGAHQRLVAQGSEALYAIAAEFVEVLRGGGKLLFCGNGGSAADAQHVVGELVGRFQSESNPWPAVSLCTDSSVITCIGNDWSFEEVFSRQVRALASAKDLVVGISTSGSSKNIIEALKAARLKGARTVAFTGSKASDVQKLADLCFQAPSADTPRIQELHILAWHAVCGVVEAEMMAHH